MELAALLDTAARRGLDNIAQVDLGSRANRHQTDHDLALMAAELLGRRARRIYPAAWLGCLPTGPLVARDAVQ